MFGGGWKFSQNFSFLAFTVCDLWYYEDLEEKAHWLSELISRKAVYRTAPATPGLLNTYIPNTLNPKQEELESWTGLVRPRDYFFFIVKTMLLTKFSSFFFANIYYFEGY